MAAAPADFRAADPAGTKLARSGGDGLELRAASRPRTSSPGSAAERRPGQTLVGFAAETGAEAIARAREKLERKGVDAIVFNDVSRPEIGFDSGDNEVTVVERDGEHAIPLATQGADRRGDPRSGGGAPRPRSPSAG